MEQTPTIYTVDQINAYVKRTLESDKLLQNVWLRGEISNFTHHASGHMYFSVKENGSVIKAIMFAGQNKKLKFTPKNGMKVILRAAISVYVPSGQYQITVQEMQPDGVGNLYLAYEELKEKLEKEGLFAAQRKRAIPKFPKVIGIITSPTGAAVQDMITTIQRRYPVAKIQLFPVLVQGEMSAQSIVNGIERMNQQNDANILIVGRGGGSIEDLWSFNDERVARAIAASAIPIISAVGHETDFTIADFVADMRAPTPTAAAEIATAMTVSDTRQFIAQIEHKFKRTLQSKLHLYEERLKKNQQLLDFYHPKKQLQDAYQKKDLVFDRLVQSMERKTKDTAVRLQRLDELLLANMQTIVKRKENELLLRMAKLDSFSPLKTLSRGYSVAYKGSTLVKQREQISIHDEISLKITDATLTCRVEKIEEELQ